MSKKSQTPEEIEKRMIRAGAFHPDDLPFNQIGELSQRQRGWLQLEIVGWGLQIAMEAAIIILAWVFFYIQSQHNNPLIALVGGTFWTVVLGGAISMCVNNIKPIWIDLTQNEARSITGIISKSTSFSMARGRANIAYWYVEIKDYQFSVLPFVHNSLIEQQSYRIFYTPRLQRVLNIEPIFSMKTNSTPDEEQAI